MRYSIRSLLRTPGFTIAAVLTLALGIGANTAVFSVADAVVFRPLPYQDANRLVMVWDKLPKLGLDQFPPPFANYYDYQSRNKVFEDIAAFFYTELDLAGTPTPQHLEAMSVSSNLFSILGVYPAIGQAFTSDQNRPGRDDAVILSHSLWQSRYGSDKAVLGQPIQLNGRPYRIQGVMPAGFGFTIRTGGSPDLWIPMLLPRGGPRTDGLLRLIARLKPGISIEQAQANMSTVASQIKAAYHPYTGPHGEDSGYTVSVIPLREQLFGGFRSGVLLLLGAVLFVLLIACVNVANLLLARAARREREFAIRVALGASRWQLISLRAAESLVLTSVGAALGLVLARWGVSALESLGSLPEQARIGIDLRVLTFTLLASIATGLLFGLAPAIPGSKADLNLSGGRTVVGTGPRRLRGGLVAMEVALSVVLLIGAGLLIRSLMRLQSVDPGFNPRNVLSMRIALPNLRYREPHQRAVFFERAIEAFEQQPGIQSAAVVSRLPLSGGGRGGDPFSIEGRPYRFSGTVPQVCTFYTVSPDYFKTMQIPLISGRFIVDRDGVDAPKIAVINETMARGFWPSGDAIGQRILMGAPRPGAPWLTIVGIVRDIRNSGLRTEPIPQLYAPYAQTPGPSMYVVLRTASDPMSAALAASRQLSEIDKEQPVYDVKTMDERLSLSISRDRFQTVLLAIFAFAALLLAAIGIYGVLEHSVSQRIPEMGIRMALGAQRSDVLRLIIGQGMRPAVIGMALGILAALALHRFVASLLFGIAPTDLATYAAVCGIFASVAFLACFIPARKATRVDPMSALRYE